MTIFSLRRHTKGLGLSPGRSRSTSAGSPGDTEAPSVPQNLVATAVSSSQIDLTWDASTDDVAVVGYRIYRDNVLVDTSPTNAYADTGLDPATEYEYEVSAIDAASNESARSTPDSATTQSAGDPEAPSVPQNLIATAVSSSQIDLTWNASTDNVAVTGYNIFRDNVLIDTSPTNAYSDSGLNPATLYQYEVSAFDAAANESARSAPDSATTQQAIVTAGLIAEWRFDAGAGQQVTDYAGGFHGTLGIDGTVESGEPTWSATGVDCTLNAAANWISVGSTLGISGGAARTVICVAQINRVDGNTEGCGFGSWTGSGAGGSRWWFSPVFGTRNLALITNGGQRHEFSTLNPLPNATWMFIGLTQSGGNINTCVGYRDGTSEAATANVALSTTGNFQIQSRGNSSGALTWGKVAYQLVYNRALSPAEIEQNRQALKAILAGRGITLP